MYNNFFNDSDEVTDKSRNREPDEIFNVDSSEAKNSINYGSSLNYGSNTKNNYLSGVKQKAKYPWDIKSTLENLYPTENKKQSNVGKKTDFNQPLLGLMDISVKRNNYGRQKDSFEQPIDILGQKFLGVFIRAPAIDSYDETKDDIKVLSEYDGEIVAIQQGCNIAISFHPELTEDTLIHEYFINEVLNKIN